jgi:hypothetical protein
MDAVERSRKAAYEGLWGCRLSYARIVTPVEPPAIKRFLGHEGKNGPWVYDWYSHIIFSDRLREAACGLNRAKPVDEVAAAIAVFAAHWSHFKPLRDVLHHPASKKFNVESLWVGNDSIWYQDEGRPREWDFTVDELHDPVERLYAVIEDV